MPPAPSTASGEPPATPTILRDCGAVPRRCQISPHFEQLLEAQAGVFSRSQALACGWTSRALDHALQRRAVRPVLRGIYSAREVREPQRMTAALLWCKAGSALDGATACRVHGLAQLPDDERIYVAVPRPRQPASTSFVVVRRTGAPVTSTQRSGLPVLALPDAVIAACRRMTARRDVRALVAERVQRRMTTVDRLATAVERAPQQNVRLVREVLAEVGRGARSAPEAEFASLVATSAVLPRPLLNCRLFDTGGVLLGDADAYWPEAALVHETDSKQWHLAPSEWEATMRRHARMTAAGLLVIHSPPSRIRADSRRLLEELEHAYITGRERGPAPGVSHRVAC